MSLPIFSSRTPAFKQWLKEMLARRSTLGDGVEGAVASIIEAVRERGDDALIEFTERYDHGTLTKSALRVSPREISAALKSMASEERKALELAARRIREFHSHTLEKSFSYKDQFGMRLGQLVQPLDRVGIYVPGGAAAYPSTVLMNALPARVAGVNEIVMMCPTASDIHPKVVLAAAAIAEVDEVYRVGGAQAIAALAYGTETIRKVDKIVGPGNAYVQTAKRMVYGVVDIDKTAGPSEVLIIADGSADPSWVAADLIAQAEHGSGGEWAMVVTTSHTTAKNVVQALEEGLLDLPRAEAVKAVLERRGAVVLVKNLAEACEISNQIAPEHLEIEVREPQQLLKSVRAAGAVFLGRLTPLPWAIISPVPTISCLPEAAPGLPLPWGRTISSSEPV